MPRTRMFKTLGCLVSAMSVTGVFLSWLAPSADLLPEREQIRRALDRARSAVARSGADRAGSPHHSAWRGIEIVPGPSTAAATSLLAARSGQETCHFSVDDAGIADSLPPWQSARSAAHRDGIVRIRVSQTDFDQPMSAAQWLAVRSLIAALSGTTDHLGPSLPIRLHAEWARVYGVSESAVFELAPATAAG